MLALRHSRERATYGGDLDGQVGILDHDTGPRLFHDHRLFDVLPGATDQCGEHGDSARAKRGGFTVMSQHAGFGVQPERSELVNRAHSDRRG